MGIQQTVKIMVCPKCGGALLRVIVRPDRSTIVCASPKCGESILDLTGSPEVFARQKTRDVEMNDAPVVVKGGDGKIVKN